MRSLFSLLFICAVLPAYSQNYSIPDLEISNDTATVLQLYEIGKTLHQQSDLDSAKQYFLIGDSIANLINYTNGKIKIWRNLGSIEARNGDIAAAHSWLDKGLQLIESENLPIINRVDYLINKGVVYYFNGELAKALEPYIEATQICRENGFDAKRSMLLNNTGIFYRKLERYDESIEIYKESFKLRSELKDTMGMANNLHNLTAVYGKIGDHENALQSVQGARELFTLIESKNDLLLSILSEGTVLNDLGRKEEAFETLKELNQIQELPFDPEHLNNYHLLMSTLYLEKDELESAMRYLNKIDTAIESSDLTDYKIELFKLKAKVLQRQGNYQASNEYLNKYIDINVDRTDIQNIKVLKEMETKYLSNEKDQKIALLSVENSLHETQLLASRQRNIFFLIGFIAFGIISFLLYLLNSKMKIKNAVINKSNEENETLLKEIHHRVKNNLQVISALLSLQSKYISDNNALEAIREGHDRVESMALIHKDLYQHDNLKGVNTKFYLEQLIENLFNSYKIQEEEIELELDIESIWLDVDTMIPLGLMINELLSNALKHAFLDQEGGVLNISLKDKVDHLELIVKDNGKGVDDIEEMHNNSFGYSLVQSFAKKLDADIQYKNEKGLSLKLTIRDYEKVA